MKPMIEYHFDIEHNNVVTNHYEIRETSMSFESIYADGWKWTQKLTPTGLEWPRWAWPGGYPFCYLVKDGGVICTTCANQELSRTLDPSDDQFFIIASDINYEDPHLHCDHCGVRIEVGLCRT